MYMIVAVVSLLESSNLENIFYSFIPIPYIIIFYEIQSAIIQPARFIHDNENNL